MLRLDLVSRFVGILLLTFAFFAFGTVVAADPIPTYVMTKGSIVLWYTLPDEGGGPFSFSGPLGSFTDSMVDIPISWSSLAPGSTINFYAKLWAGVGAKRINFELNGAFIVPEPNTIDPSVTVVFPVVVVPLYAIPPYGPNSALILLCGEQNYCGSDPNEPRSSVYAVLDLQGPWTATLNLHYDNGYYNGYRAYLQLNPAPEPGTLLLLGTGVAGICLKRKRRVI